MNGVISPSASAGSSQRLTSVTCTPIVSVPAGASAASAGDTHDSAATSRITPVSERTDISKPPDRLGCREARCRAGGWSHGGGAAGSCQASDAHTTRDRSDRAHDARSEERAMYEGFRRFDIETGDPGVAIRGVVGGEGPSLLLLHGNPLTHIHWRLVAPRLAT